jgi:uncharacterized membrane-anchored protein
MNGTTPRPRKSVKIPTTLMTLGLVFLVIGLYQVLKGASSLTVGLLALMVGLFSCGLAVYRIFYLRGISDT